MTRLTKYEREAIAAKAVAHAFDPKKVAIETTEDALGREAYAVVIPASESAAAAKMPTNWFRLDKCLRFNVGGQSISLSLSGEGLPVPYQAKGEEYGSYHCGRLGTILPGDLCDRIQAHAQAKEDYRNQRGAAYRSVFALVASVTTIKRLREIWPEGEAFFKGYDESAPSNLPAVRTDEVNAMLGLALAA